MAAVHAASGQPAARVESPSASIAAAPALSVDKGRELARLQVVEMIRKIQLRARQHRLDRGLRVSLPYFDDAGRELRWREMVVIPGGRIPFVPAFVVVAARQEIQRVQSEPQLSETTRVHVVGLLEMLAEAFEADPSSDGAPSGGRL